ncbi:hypothetical protein [Congregibacter sp.]|uniref:hypothetical protein n=1 Tax=Congregibacter sp. TaxID=2744308 RepID=UPI003F6BD5DB
MQFLSKPLPYVRAMIWFWPLVLFAGCGSGSDSHQGSSVSPVPAPGISEPEVDRRSVLEGGPYGTVEFKLLDKQSNAREESAPAFGLFDPSQVFTKGLDFRNQFVFPFGGYLTTLGDNLHRSGNTRTNEPVEAVLRLYPNTGLLTNLVGQGEAVLTLTPVALTGDGGIECFVRLEEDALAMQLFERDGSCIDVTLTIEELRENFNGVEFIFDLGEFTEASSLSLTADFSLEVPGGSAAGVVQSNTGAAELNLSVNEAVAVDLPPNVYASGVFLPTLDGFGFSNLGDGSYDIFSKELIARQYGKEVVCFIENGSCKALNPYGLFLVSTLDPHNASNGLCNGMAVAATMLANGIEPFPDSGKTLPADYNPLAARTIDLNYGDVRELIASKQIGQRRDAVVDRRNACMGLKPTEVMAEIEARFNTDDPIAVLSISTLAGEGGHAVTPYALSAEGGNIRRIYVYDNNNPSDMNRFIEVDITPGKETWQYRAATNASGEVYAYEGMEATNSMCPQPVSLYTADDVLTQPPGTVQFIDLTGVNAQVADSEGRASGADFEALVNINEIPGATLQTLTGSNLLTISGLSPGPEPADFDGEKLREYLNNSYVITAQPVTEKAASELKFLQSSLIDSRVTSAYVGKLVPQQPLSMDTRQVFRSDAAARFIAVEKPPAGTFLIKAFTTDNELQIGHIATVQIVTSDLGVNDSVGVFVADDGTRYVVFSYDAATGGGFTKLEQGVDYELNLDSLDVATIPFG